VLTVMTNQKLSVETATRHFTTFMDPSQANPGFNIAQADKARKTHSRLRSPKRHFTFGCDLHRWMGAFVGVFDHPFHTTSGVSGDYESAPSSGQI
jgi:hypothetical protein